MKSIVGTIVVFSLLLLPIDHRLMSVGDDDDYFAVATAIAFGQFPSFADEYHVGQKMPFASVGPGLMAAPFVFAFSLVDRATNEPIVRKRDKENRYWTWTLFGFQFAVYVYLLIGALLLYQALKRWGTEFSALLTTQMIIVAGGGLLIYAFRRPIMSHVFEFFTVTLAVFLITGLLKGDRSRWWPELFGLCAALIFLTRYNNAFLAVGLLSAFLYVLWKQTRQMGWMTLFRTGFWFSVPILVFRVLPVLANGWSAHDQGYAGAFDRIIPALDPLFYWVRLGEVFLGMDMGILYTAPALPIAILALWMNRNRIPGVFFFLAAFAAINLYLAMAWKSFGSYYGYRYVVFTALPLLSPFLVCFFDQARARLGKLRVILFCILLAYFPVMSMLVFERTATYGFHLVVNSYGVDTYTQPTYHKDLLVELVHDPFTTPAKVIGASWVRLMTDGMPEEHLLQRAMLYIVPPLIVLLSLAGVRRWRPLGAAAA